MLFKGRQYTECPNVHMLPNRDRDGNLLSHVPAGQENYVFFGRSFNDRRVADKMIETEYKYRDTEKSVYALPIPHHGHSLTNLMFGADGYMYLAYNGKCWRTKSPKLSPLAKRLLKTTR